MSNIEAIGAVAIGLTTLIGLIVVIVKPFADITKTTSSIEKAVVALDGTVGFLGETVKDLKDLLSEQKVINEKFHRRFAKLETEIKNVQHQCELIHQHDKVKDILAIKHID